MSIPPRIFEPMNVELTTEPLYATSISPYPRLRLRSGSSKWAYVRKRT